ncbi:MAG: OmpA family protein [Pseudomonadota bacterium]
MRSALLMALTALALTACADAPKSFISGSKTPDVAPVTAGGGTIVRIAQTAPAARATLPKFTLCGGEVPCPEATRKTLAAAIPLPPPAPPVPPVRPPEPVAKKAPVIRSVAVRFAFARANLTARDLAPLQGLMEDMRSAERVTLRGRTDAVGGKPDNDRLALRRAEAVREYLIGYGLDAGRIGIEAEGKCCYTASNRTPEGRAANRRVEVVITIVMKE